MISGQTDAAARWLREAQEHIEAAGPPPAQREILAFAAAVEALIAGYTGEMSRAADRARAALAAISADKIGMRNTLTYILAFAEYMEGDLTAAARDFLEAAGNDRAHRSTNALAAAMSKLAQIYLVEGRLPEAARVCRESLQLVAEQGAERFYVAGNLRLTLGSVLIEWGDRDAALAEIARGIAENGKWAVANSDVYGQAVLARALLAAGDSGRRAGRGAGGRADQPRPPCHGDVASELAASRARLWLAAGDLHAAAQWAEAGGLGAAEPLCFRHELDQPDAGAHPSGARADRRGPATAGAPRRRRAGGGPQRAARRDPTLQAVACARRGELSAAVAALGCALALAEPGGYAGAFLDEGAPLRALLAHGLARECWPDTVRRYTRKLLTLRAADQASAPPPAEFPLAPYPQARESRLIEPLTPREREVLRLMAGGRSYGEIAAALVVTAGTVKTHAHHIYGKLDCRTCVSAVARARELGLV